MNINKLVLTDKEIRRQPGRRMLPANECDRQVSLATVKKVVKYIDKERGAWYNGGVIIGKEVWEVLEKALEEGK